MQSDEIYIKFGDSEYKKDYVNAEPLLKSTADGFILTMGNTGFEYRVEKNSNGELTSRFDFEPEGKVGIQETNGVLYARILGLSLLETRHWLLANRNIEVNRILLDKVPPIVIKSARFDLLNSLYSLFNNHGDHDDFISTYKDGIDLRIEMSSFVNLSEEDPLIIYLKKITQNLKGVQIYHTEFKKDPE